MKANLLVSLVGAFLPWLRLEEEQEEAVLPPQSGQSRKGAQAVLKAQQSLNAGATWVY